MAELEPALRTQLEDLAKRLPELWETGKLSPSQKKELLRSLVRRVVLSRPEQDVVEVKVVWVSGAYSVVRVNPPVLHRTTQLSNHGELVARILELAAEGHQDTEIARRLTKEGFRSARLPYVTRPLVEKIRTKHGQTDSHPSPQASIPARRSTGAGACPVSHEGLARAKPGCAQR